MATATVRQGDEFVHVLIAVLAAVLLHAVAFVLFWLWQWAMLVYESKHAPPPVPELVEDGTVTVELNAAMFERFEMPPPPPVAAVPPDPESPAEKSFLKTAPEQESSESPENAQFIGERNTIAASELPPDPNAPLVPAQDGEDPRMKDDRNTIDSRFTDGEEPAEVGSGELEPQTKAGQPTDQPPGDGQPGDPDGAEREQEASAMKEKFLESENQVPVPVVEGRQNEKMEETLPKKSDAESETEGARDGEGGLADKTVEEQPKKSGFRTQSKKTRMRGSVSRRGRSAMDVDDTIVGRYQAKVSRALESEWQKKCIAYRDHISPGILTIRFFVDEKGQTSNMRYLDVLQASEIQKGFTINAIREAKIPPMPKDVVEELEGESLELIISFRF